MTNQMTNQMTNPTQLPSEVVLNPTLIPFLTFRDLLSVVTRVSKKWHAVVLNYPYIEDELRTLITYKNFIRGIQALQPYPFLQAAVLSNEATLVFAEETRAICNLPMIYRIQALSKENSGFLSHATDEVLFSVRGITALRRNLITIEQARSMSAAHLNIMLRKVGLQVLKEVLMTVEQVLKIPIHNLEILIPNDEKDLNCLQALRLQLITPKEFTYFNWHVLKILFSKNGIQALQERIISLEEIKAMPDVRLLYRLIKSNWGLIALRKKLITLQMLYNECNLSLLLQQNGIIALEEKLLTVKDVNMIGYITLEDILSQSGFEAFRKGFITLEACFKYKPAMSYDSYDGDEPLDTQDRRLLHLINLSDPRGRIWKSLEEYLSSSYSSPQTLKSYLWNCAKEKPQEIFSGQWEDFSPQQLFTTIKSLTENGSVEGRLSRVEQARLWSRCLDKTSELGQQFSKQGMGFFVKNKSILELIKKEISYLGFKEVNNINLPAPKAPRSPLNDYSMGLTI